MNGVTNNGALAWVAGLYLFEEDARGNVDVELFRGYQSNPASPVDGTLLFLQAFNSNFQDYDATNESQAIFAEGTYAFTDKLSVTAGVRYSQDDRRLSLLQELLSGGADPAYMCPGGVAPILRTCERSGSFSELTPRVIVSHQFSDNVMIYGGWSKGYSSGGFNQNPALQDYAPEVSKNWEFGFKSTLADGRLRLNATTFLNTYENQQLSVARIINNQNVIAILNAQEATLFGFEAEAVALIGNWTTTLAAGTTDGEYEEFEVLDTTIGPAPDLIETTELRNLKSNELVLGPPFTFSLGISNTLEIGSGRLVSQLGWAHRGRQFYDISAFKGTEQDAFGLMDGRVTYFFANERTTLSLQGTNLLDKEWYTAAGGDANAARLAFLAGEPRRMALQLRHKLSR